MSYTELALRSEAFQRIVKTDMNLSILRSLWISAIAVILWIPLKAGGQALLPSTL